MQSHNASTSPKKPSPLSFGSPRQSPFKRPESSLTRSPSTLRADPTAPSPVKAPAFSISAAQQLQGPREVPAAIQKPAAPVQIPSPIGAHVSNKTPAPTAPVSATQARPSPTSHAGGIVNTTDPLGKLHPIQVHDLRESFQVLDRDNDGSITREDVADVLTQLGLDTSPSALHPYFPTNSAASLSLPTYLSSLSSLLASLSPESELAAAFGAFDIDDSGQIDIDELKDALTHTAPEGGIYGRTLSGADVDSAVEPFRGKRALAKGMFGGKEPTRRGDVFRYKEFLSSISGSADRQAQGHKAAASVKA